MSIHGNPELKLPASVLGVQSDGWNQDDETAPKPGPLLDYYFGKVRADERRPLNKAKLIMVARGEAGTT